MGIVLCSACSSTEYPSIDEDKMVDIMIDLSVADHVTNKYPANLRDSINSVLMESLLRIHNISREELDTNLYLYQVDLRGYKKVVEKMVRRFDELEKEAAAK